MCRKKKENSVEHCEKRNGRVDDREKKYELRSKHHKYFPNDKVATDMAMKFTWRSTMI